jgi:hypothetical protein
MELGGIHLDLQSCEAGKETLLGFLRQHLVGGNIGEKLFDDFLEKVFGTLSRDANC